MNSNPRYSLVISLCCRGEAENPYLIWVLPEGGVHTIVFNSKGESQRQLGSEAKGTTAD